MLHHKSTPTSDCCGGPATYQVVWMDDTETALTCTDHFGYTYELAERENAGRTFLPVHITNLAALVSA